MKLKLPFICKSCVKSIRSIELLPAVDVTFLGSKNTYDKTFLIKLAQAEIILYSQRKLGCQTYGFPLASRVTEICPQLLENKVRLTIKPSSMIYSAPVYHDGPLWSWHIMC